MKTIIIGSITPADLVDSITTITVGDQCSIYYIGDNLPDTLPIQTQVNAGIQDVYDTALTSHFNEVAAQRHYDSYLTAALRAGYPGPFRIEGIAFGSWMDLCNAQGYLLIADVLAGTRLLPTVRDFISSLPVMVWPT